MLWYFSQRGLDMSFMLGEQDANSLNIRPFGGGKRQQTTSGRKLLYEDFEQKDDPNVSPSPEATPEPPEMPPPMVLEPQSDLELLSKLRPIYEMATAATADKMKKAIAMWLTNRSQTAPERREQSIWNLSVFECFHDLGIPDAFGAGRYDEFVSQYNSATKKMTIKERDRAWNEPALSIQKCFGHPRLGNLRLRSLMPVLSGQTDDSQPPSQRSSRAPSAATGSPLGPKPQNPVPVPPSKAVLH